jgi:hypothetical protein
VNIAFVVSSDSVGRNVVEAVAVTWADITSPGVSVIPIVTSCLGYISYQA